MVYRYVINKKRKHQKQIDDVYSNSQENESFIEQLISNYTSEELKKGVIVHSKLSCLKIPYIYLRTPDQVHLNDAVHISLLEDLVALSGIKNEITEFKNERNKDGIEYVSFLIDGTRTGSVYMYDIEHIGIDEIQSWFSYMLYQADNSIDREFYALSTDSNVLCLFYLSIEELVCLTETYKFDFLD
jgi:hypothetical protein